MPCGEEQASPRRRYGRLGGLAGGDPRADADVKLHAGGGPPCRGRSSSMGKPMTSVKSSQRTCRSSIGSGSMKMMLLPRRS